MSDDNAVLIARYELIGDGPSRDEFEALLIDAGYDLELELDGSMLIIEPESRPSDHIDPNDYRTFDTMETQDHEEDQ